MKKTTCDRLLNFAILYVKISKIQNSSTNEYLNSKNYPTMNLADYIFVDKNIFPKEQ